MKNLFRSLFKEKRFVFREGGGEVHQEALDSSKYRDAVMRECQNTRDFESLKNAKDSELYKARTQVIAKIDNQVKSGVNYKNLDGVGMKALYERFGKMVDKDFEDVFNHNRTPEAVPRGWSFGLKFSDDLINGMVQEEIFKMNALRGRKEVAEQVVVTKASPDPILENTEVNKLVHEVDVVMKKIADLKVKLKNKFGDNAWKQVVDSLSRAEGFLMPMRQELFVPGFSQSRRNELASQIKAANNAIDSANKMIDRYDAGKKQKEITVEKPAEQTLESRAKTILDRVNNLRGDFQIRFSEHLPLLEDLNAMSLSLEGSLKELSAVGLDDDGLKNLETELVIAEGLIDKAKNLIVSHEKGFPKIRKEKLESYKIQKENYDKSVQKSQETIDKSLIELNTQFMKDADKVLKTLKVIQEIQVSLNIFDTELLDFGKDIAELRRMMEIVPRTSGEVQERNQTLAILNGFIDRAVNFLKKNASKNVYFNESAQRIEEMR